jgi:hypothetical protein
MSLSGRLRTPGVVPIAGLADYRAGNRVLDLEACHLLSPGFLVSQNPAQFGHIVWLLLAHDSRSYASE